MVATDVRKMFGHLFDDKLIIEQLHKGDDIGAFTTNWIVSVMLNVCMRIAG